MKEIKEMNSTCKREQSHARMNFVERKQDRSAAAILRANALNLRRIQ